MTTEVWLYGSSARGDCDALSDIDILVAGEEEIDIASLRLPSSARLSRTHYSWREIDQMATYGSLFLHHIALEGRPLLETRERRLRAILNSLGRYTRAQQELSCFRRVLADVEAAVGGEHSPAFEMSVVATAARHAAILGCYLIGEPDFGRTTAFRRLLPRIGYPLGFAQQLEDLYRYRQAENEGRQLEVIVSSKDVLESVLRVRGLLARVEELAS